MLEHTCIKDDGGTPNRRCFACQTEDVFDQLSIKIHETAQQKGWYDQGEKNRNAIIGVLNDWLPPDPNKDIANKVAVAIVNKLGLDQRNNFEMISLEHSELSETVEAFRKGNPMSEKIPPYSKVEEEDADAIIRILDRAHKNKHNLGGAILAKMKFNTTRPYKHGGKLA